MTALIDRPFLKMNGAGNEIVVLDLRDSPHVVSAAEARAIGARADAHFDQLMVLHDSGEPRVDALVRIYNADGSEAGACGNGTRCVAWAMTADPEMGDAAKETLRLRTSAGLLQARRQRHQHQRKGQAGSEAEQQHPPHRRMRVAREALAQPVRERGHSA